MRCAYLFQGDFSRVSDIAAFALEVRVRFVPYDKDNIRGNFIPPLIAFPLECDLSPRLPPGLHVNRQHLILLLRRPVRLQHIAADLHLLRTALRDILQRNVQIVLDRRVLNLILPVWRVVEIERLAAEGASAGAAAPRWAHPKQVVLRVHVGVVKDERSISTTQIEEMLEWAGIAEELGEGGPRVPVERVREVTAALRTSTTPEATLQALLTVHVVDVTFLFIGKHLVRLRDFFELLLSSGGFIFVRVVLKRELTIRFLNILIGRPFLDTKYLVIVLAHGCLTHRCLKKNSLNTHFHNALLNTHTLRYANVLQMNGKMDLRVLYSASVICLSNLREAFGMFYEASGARKVQTD